MGKNLEMNVKSEQRMDRESMNYDVVIVGGGPSGLACAIRLKQLQPELAVCVLEKGSEIGAHLLSGAVFETRALDELIPDWKEKGAPLHTKAQKDKFLYLTKHKSFRLPQPPQMSNHGNYIISLGALGKWLGEQAESLGVEIFAGFAAAEILYHNEGALKGSVKGVATGDMGVNKQGERTEMFEPGVELHAKQTVFAEGCHGSLSKILIENFNLRENSDPQTYGLGVKEVWEIAEDKHQEGLIVHTVGWPMDSKTYGGSWMYHMADRLVSIGFVVGLDYKNPYLSPFEEMQRYKTHPDIRKYLEGGKRISYGARTIVEGGYQSLPKLTFPGGILVGDSAGFLNVPKIKGNHTAIKSGMLGAEALIKALDSGETEATLYTELFEKSWIKQELYKVRNIRPAFQKGFWFGVCHAVFQTLGGWVLPYTIKNHKDHEQLMTAEQSQKIDYPKPDGVLTFDRLSSVYLSNTNHAEDQPSHLILQDVDIPVSHNLVKFGGPSQYYCPAGVYEFSSLENAPQEFIINAQNCIHCKTCDIKDPAQNIIWTVPQGGGGPNYTGM